MPQGKLPATASTQRRSVETQLRGIRQQQLVKITDQRNDIRILEDEIRTLKRMVHEYRGYPEDTDELG